MFRLAFYSPLLSPFGARECHKIQPYILGSLPFTEASANQHKPPKKTLKKRALYRVKPHHSANNHKAPSISNGECLLWFNVYGDGQFFGASTCLLGIYSNVLQLGALPHQTLALGYF